MGLFDTYGESQIKAGDPWQHNYKLGDKVTIPDGIYLGSPNFIVIKDGVFIAEVGRLYDYFGEDPLTADQIDSHYQAIYRMLTRD